jgi:phosphatidate cytidylyltransferase
MIATRIASALVLIPLALLLVTVGHPLLTVGTALAALLMVWELESFVVPADAPWGAPIAIIGALLAVLVGGFAQPLWGGLVAAAALLLRFVLHRRALRTLVWMTLGFVWIVAGCLGFLWLRTEPGGRTEVYWLFALVWSVDTAAFLVGKAIGGPRLIEHISPNKTWAGSAGGIAAGMAAGLVGASLVGREGSGFGIVMASGMLAIVEQMGDIAESYAKRRFGVKDSGSLIPGHGGLLDRLDGMLAVVAAAVLLRLIGVVVW